MGEEDDIRVGVDNATGQLGIERERTRKTLSREGEEMKGVARALIASEGQCHSEKGRR